ncbi:hypothetical protein AAFF_G00019780 [Aldrovandia affinis]|uniref:Uncharacterized protein n=1 Tax=Aldrovandia affinis TaxID=143900 RepID=A0AAD7WGM6_9TELE|nr:hypothetical protein AAFF_G00019780 [Aldrovandia affinis]
MSDTGAAATGDEKNKPAGRADDSTGKKEAGSISMKEKLELQFTLSAVIFGSWFQVSNVEKKWTNTALLCSVD